MLLDWDVNWTYFHGDLPAGRYRITKTALDFREPEDFAKYNLAAEFTILDEEDNKELNEENEKTFYEAAEAFGLEKEEAEGYFQMLCQDGVC